MYSNIWYTCCIMYPLRYLSSGHIFIDSADDCDMVVDAMLGTDYSEDFCLARDFREDFICRLMEAGFLVMSMELKEREEENTVIPKDRFFVLLPKLHLIRSVLFFPELYIKKSIRPFLLQYELKTDTDFDLILDNCINTHGEEWLTPPLVNIIKGMHQSSAGGLQNKNTRPFSFGVYRDGELKAGEFGIVTGKVYTSYSGYYRESNAGTAQMILMAQWLEKSGFAFLDFGMPLDYKTALGAQNVNPHRFVELFRAAR